jgi:hypothetical protein
MLFMRGEADEAYAIVATSFADRDSADPFRLYSLGDYRVWTDLIAQLREGARR